MTTHRRILACLAVANLALVQLAGCAFGVALDKQERIEDQERRLAAIVPGETTRNSVREALGAPWLHSEFWGFDLYLAQDVVREVGGPVILLVPIPVGVFKTRTSSFAMVSYDQAGRVQATTTGQASRAMGNQDSLLLRGAELAIGIETAGERGIHLMAEMSRLDGYLLRRRQAGACTLVLACEETSHQRWPYESCPDRVSIDGQSPVDPQPFFGRCEAGTSCATAQDAETGFLHWPLALPLSLPAGTHQLVTESSTFKGSSRTQFDCAEGQVRYARIRGQIDWHWWGPRTSTLRNSVSFEETLPRGWERYRLLLFRTDRWMALPEPDLP